MELLWGNGWPADGGVHVIEGSLYLCQCGIDNLAHFANGVIVGDTVFQTDIA